MQIVVNALLSRIREYNPELNEAQIRSRKFGLEVFVNELSKTLIYLLIFALFSLAGYYLMSVLIYCTIRIVSGGYHAKSYWGCLIVSFIGFAVPVFCSQYIVLEWYEKSVLLMASIVITMAFAPVNHKNTPKKNLPNAGKFKMLSIVMVAFWSILTFLLPGAWSTTAVFTIFVEAVMQPLGKLFNPIVKLKSETGV
jgi:accessory gene regulator B